MLEVRPERTGWRDEGLSLRHREWGYDCPAIDLDFLLIEYDIGKVCGLVEYKNEHAQIPNFNSPSIKALIDLGDKAEVPVFLCRYTDDFSRWFPIPLNEKAKEWLLPWETEMTELEWVTFLYRIRGRKMSLSIEEKLRGEA